MLFEKSFFDKWVLRSIYVNTFLKIYPAPPSSRAHVTAKLARALVRPEEVGFQAFEWPWLDGLKEEKPKIIGERFFKGPLI